MGYNEFNENDIAEACWDAYYEALEKYYYLHRRIKKDWEDLNFFEVEQVKRDYHAAEQWNAHSDDYNYMVEGSR